MQKWQVGLTDINALSMEQSPGRTKVNGDTVNEAPLALWVAGTVWSVEVWIKLGSNSAPIFLLYIVRCKPNGAQIMGILVWLDL